MLKVNNEFEVRSLFRILNLENLPNKLILLQFSIFNCNKNSHSQVLQTIYVLKNFAKIIKKTNVTLSSVFSKVSDCTGTHKFSFTLDIYRSSPLEVFLGKGVLKICSKFTAKYPCRSAISIKLQSNFIEITLRHGCSPVNLLHIFRTPFLKNTSEGLPLYLL